MTVSLLTALYNLAFVLLLSPLYAGINRKIRARVHSRQGPPVLQPYRDILKLLGKEDCQVSDDPVHRLAPYLVLTGALAAALLVPMGFRAPLGFAGDGLVLIYLLTFSAIGTVLAGLSSRNPFAGAGASREIMLLLAVEPVLAAAFFTFGTRAGSLGLAEIARGIAQAGFAPSLVVAALAAFLAIQAESAKLPFDVAEAETEIIGGPYVEYSGPSLAAFEWALMVRRVVLASFLVALLGAWPAEAPLWLAVLLHPVKVLVVLVLTELVAVLSPRVRIRQAIRFYEGAGVLAVAGLLVAIFGF
ncbi:formate hydrogenlyase subunit 4 [Symbiobacterium terraclitae]|uniref:Formate hydrogenlyase subunit 4 n=1 Tax=Symbiobacterium terraclitae TaxID=557451 RepID=A0ABS4JTM9_9FIRM|nr:formate hydrogenlyase subunit 4 [Symbiobacterium terraclitae]